MDATTVSGGEPSLPYPGEVANRGLRFLFVFTTAVATWRALVGLAAPTLEYALLVASTALFCIIGVFVWSSRTSYLKPLPMQVLLALVMLAAGRSVGPLELILFPVAAQGALGLRVRPSLAFAAALSLALAAPFAWWGIPFPGPMLVSMTGPAAGIFFTVLFTQVLRNEIITRVAAQAGEREAIQQAALTEERERLRLAREIHDGIGHTLTAVGVQLETANELLPDRSEDAARHVARARELARRGLQDVRDSVSAMRDRPADARSLAALAEELADEAREAGIDVEVSIEGDMTQLEAPALNALHRALQEALTNVRRHSAATEVSIRLHDDRRATRLEVINDGVGEPAEGGSGFGLTGARERAALLGGTLEAGARDGSFRFFLEVPR